MTPSPGPLVTNKGTIRNLSKGVRRFKAPSRGVSPGPSVLSRLPGSNSCPRGPGGQLPGWLSWERAGLGAPAAREPRVGGLAHCRLLPQSRLDKGLAVLVRERGADLVVIEGMGRAVHTNYHAALCCESLKLAVIKNSWLAERLGGRLFSVIFKYEVPAE